MQAKSPKNTNCYFWTEHVKFKMRFYGLSEQKVLGVISSPKRKEEGIVEKTIAVMKPVSPKVVGGKEVWKQEVWVMYQKHEACSMKHETPARNATHSVAGGKNSNTKYPIPNAKCKIISAWRYPGVSPEKNPIPQEILRELSEIS
jgi:hypothetical protein